MEVARLRTFIAVAEEGSITGGARRLLTTQPAVTRQIAALERSVGARLLDRKPHGVALTDAGRRLLLAARDVVMRFDQLARADGTGPGPSRRTPLRESGSWTRASGCGPRPSYRRSATSRRRRR